MRFSAALILLNALLQSLAPAHLAKVAAAYQRAPGLSGLWAAMQELAAETTSDPTMPSAMQKAVQAESMRRGEIWTTEHLHAAVAEHAPLLMTPPDPIHGD